MRNRKVSAGCFLIQILVVGLMWGCMAVKTVAEAKMTSIEEKKRSDKVKTDAYLKEVWSELQSEVKAGNMSSEEAKDKMTAIKKEIAAKIKDYADKEHYTHKFTSDSLSQEGVPKGKVTKHLWDESKIYPGITHSGWVYVPAQYDEAKPACVMVFLDGADFILSKGEVRVPTVFDNLIHKGEIPVTIGIFINPGRKDSGFSNRDEEYLPLNDTYACFLLEEILPEVGKDYNLVDDAAGRAVCGMSDGGVGTFTVAWERPDAFSKAMSFIGSFVRVPGGGEYPCLIRKTRGSPKPIRVFIQDNENDLNIIQGNWTLGNIAMESALMFARYDYRFEMGTGGHDLAHGGAIFPDALRWIWRDYPGVKGAGDAPDLDAVIGQCDVTTNTLGEVTHRVLTVTEQGGALSAILTDKKGGEIKVTAISFKDDILSYEYRPPQSEWGKEKESKGKDSKGKDSASTMTTWLKVNGNTFEGAVSPTEKSEIDFSVKGRKTDGASEDASERMPQLSANQEEYPLTDITDTRGLLSRTLIHDSITREYILYVPDCYDGTSKVPLMLNFHGFGGYANTYLNYADMRSLADTENFILVYPQGSLLEGAPHWNCSLPSEDNKSDADDFGFVAAMIDRICSNYNIDSERVYACGYSNGAFLSYALARYLNDKIAAIGSVAGTMLDDIYSECGLSHPTAMINIHGTSDDVVPYGGSKGFTAIDEVLDYWVSLNNTSTTPIIKSVNDNGTTIEHYSYTDGDNNTAVEHYKIIGGGHVWFDISYEGSNTSRLIWDFVSRYDINGLR